MKKHFLLLLLGAIVSVISMAQAQNSFKYQAVLRDTEEKIIANENVQLRMTIIMGVENGTEVYSETHNKETSSLGLIYLNIGEGSVLSGSFQNIIWGNDSYFLKLEIDRNNSGYTAMGTTPFLSVPYALHAQTVSDKDDADANPQNEIQDLQLDGTTLSISNGNNVDLSVLQDGTEDADSNPTNEIQNISISNDSIYLSDGGVVKLPAGTSFSGSFNDLNDIPTNLDVDSTNDFSGDYNALDNKPDLSNFDQNVSDDFSGNYIDLTNKPTLVGDVSGDLNTNTVQKIQGKYVSANIPSDGQVLKWDDASSTWIPGQDQLGAAGTTDGVVESVGVSGSTTKTITVNRSNALPNLTATFTDEVDDADANSSNEIQDISLSATELSITDGSTVDLSSIQDGTGTDDQNLVLTSNTLTIEGGTGSVDLSNYIDDADANPANEIQSLSLTGTVLSISGAPGTVDISTASPWQVVADSIFVPTGNVGLGTNSPAGRLEVKGNSIDTPDDLLFSVVNNAGDTVFAVYQGGVKITVNGESTKAARGGFAVASMTSGTKGTQDLFHVSNDSVRIYLDESVTKAARGGFAVASMTSGTKGIEQDILRVTSDSVRIYLDESPTKAARGGFAVASMTSGTKGTDQEILRVTGDSTRIYVNDSTAGFSIANIGSGEKQNFMEMTTENYYIGHESGKSTKPLIGIGDEGKYNVFIGYQSGLKNILGANNVFLGYKAGYSNTASKNVFIGNKSGVANKAGQYNTFVGTTSGASNIDGDGNTFMGYSCGSNNIDGDDNTFIGYLTGAGNLSGLGNTFLGHFTGVGMESGNYNTFIGDYAGMQNISGSGNVFIGRQAGMYESGSDQLFIHNSSTATPLIWGNFLADSEEVRINGNLFVTGTAGGSSSWSAKSDLSLKSNIMTISGALSKVLMLRGVTFNWKDTEKFSPGSKIGFIAQEVDEVVPEVVNKTDNLYSMQYGPITALLVEALKEQQKIISEQQELINTVKEDNTLLRKTNDEIKQEVEKIKNWLNMPDE